MVMRNSELKSKECEKSQLTGYREPLTWEKSEIKRRVLSDLKSLRKKQQIAEFLLFLFAVLLFLGVFAGITSLSGGELVIVLLLAVISIVMGMVTRTRRSINKEFIENMQQDYFQVMDCKAFDANINVDIIGCGVVKIYNEQGQYCREFFSVDRRSVKEYINGEEPSFLLMKCVCTGKKPEEFYQLFSRKGLEGQ